MNFSETIPPLPSNAFIPFSTPTCDLDPINITQESIDPALLPHLLAEQNRRLQIESDLKNQFILRHLDTTMENIITQIFDFIKTDPSMLKELQNALKNKTEASGIEVYDLLINSLKKDIEPPNLQQTLGQDPVAQDWTWMNRYNLPLQKIFKDFELALMLIQTPIPPKDRVNLQHIIHKEHLLNPNTGLIALPSMKTTTHALLIILRETAKLSLKVASHLWLPLLLLLLFA